MTTLSMMPMAMPALAPGWRPEDDVVKPEPEPEPEEVVRVGVAAVWC